MSSFSWLAFNESDRRAALDVIDLFREQDTRDELGLATIRDTFSDLLFPGTSAIQTRARYFLIVPWVYQRIEKNRVSSAEVSDKARRDEIDLIDVLAKSEDAKGTIGIRARKTLKRVPSIIYWQGLDRWGIKTFRGTRDQYHRSLDRLYARNAGPVRNDDGEVVDGGRIRNWDRDIPPAPTGFPRTCSLALTFREAEYLRDRIRHAAGQTLLAHLVNLDVDAPEVAFPWEHPLASGFPAGIRRILKHGQYFSDVMHGASLLYNCILSELLKNEEMVAKYRAGIDEWRDRIRSERDQHQNWSREEFWRVVVEEGHGRIPPGSRAFVNAWLDLILSQSGIDLASSEIARSLVKERERALKRGMARVDGGRALEIWGGAAGARQMDYRWTSTARGIVQDIHDGMGRTNA